MRLLHLTAIGPQVPPATVEFAPKLTVVYGASETGKSYIIDALDFMFGGRALRKIPQADPYRTMLLGLQMQDGTIITLARDLRGGRVSVYEEDIRELPDRIPDQVLLGQHNKKNKENISYFLLSDLGIADAHLRKNNRNELQAMSFRNVAHVCLVDEGRVPSETSPVQSGVPTARTAEGSVFKLLLEGEDDSGLNPGEDPVQFKRVNRGQVEVLDRALHQLQELVSDAPERPALLDQLARVNESIAESSASMEDVLTRRDGLMSQRDEVQTSIRQQRHLLLDTQTLMSRFSLLDQQYASDIDRLNMVKEAGTFLGFFDSEVCVFCGASPDHQHPNHALYETTELVRSVDAELEKTVALKEDLAQTFNGIMSEQTQGQEYLNVLTEELFQISQSLSSLDREVQPVRDDMALLIDKRSEIEGDLGLWDRISDLEALRSSVAQESAAVSDSVSTGVLPETQREFSRTLNNVLTAWQVPGAEDSYFDFNGEPDVILDNRSRASRGKGMRSIMHAGFSIALSEFCMERELPHPGFVAIDTPVLTYRDAEKGDVLKSNDELLNQSVADAFYSYLGNRHDGQVLVIENQTPPKVNESGCSVIYFSGTAGVERSGFYPQ